MSDRATGLFPLPRECVVVPPGMELTAEHRAALDVRERWAPGPDGDVRVVGYRPRGASGRLPLVVHLHGSAFCCQAPESFAAMDAGHAMRLGCVAASVN